jgi:hypothetical protein
MLDKIVLDVRVGGYSVLWKYARIGHDMMMEGHTKRVGLYIYDYRRVEALSSLSLGLKEDDGSSEDSFCVLTCLRYSVFTIRSKLTRAKLNGLISRTFRDINARANTFSHCSSHHTRIRLFFTILSQAKSKVSVSFSVRV